MSKVKTSKKKESLKEKKENLKEGEVLEWGPDVEAHLSEKDEEVKDGKVDEPAPKEVSEEAPQEVSQETIFAEVEDLLVTEPEPQTEKVEQHSLIPEDGALHGASRNVVTANSVLKKVNNRPRVFNQGGVPTTVKSVVESNRTGFFRIHRDRDIKN